MKFICSVNINLPRTKVIELFDNSDNLKQWQDGFISFEHISGEPGKKGAKSQMRYKIGKREIELIETIITNNLPDEFIGHYKANAMENSMKNNNVFDVIIYVI